MQHTQFEYQKMDAEDSTTTENVALSLFCNCNVCKNMDTTDIQLLTEYVEEVCQKNSLSTSIKLAVEFCSALRMKKSARSEKVMHNGSSNVIHKYNFDEGDITRHMLYCVSTKCTSLRNMICTTKAMKMLIESQTIQQTSTAIKLLQSSHPSTKASGADT